MNGEYISFEEGFGKNGKISIQDLLKQEIKEDGSINIEDCDM